ncbi:MAG: hypothetical protein JO362_13065 [Streptomycetaceae bacterium]|nr:hypothetical protein [Streptomycetaceae bacterium]
MATEGGLASQLFALAKDLAKVEKDVAELGERDNNVQATLAGLDLTPVQEAIDHLEERTAGLQEEVKALAPFREGLTALTKAVTQLRKDLEALAAGPAEEKLAVWDWSWDGMDKAEAGDAWATLVKWVREVLAGQYGWVGPPAEFFSQASFGGQPQPGARPRIPACWYRHREAVIELSALCQEHQKIYKTSYGTPSRALDWHDRYAPGVMRRLTSALSKCATEKGHVSDLWADDPVNHPHAPRGIDNDEQLSTWITWDMNYRADPPAPGPVAATS